MYLHCDEYRLREMLMGEPADVMVAHSARFERGFIADTATGGLPSSRKYTRPLRSC